MAESTLDPILAALSYETIEWLISFRDYLPLKKWPLVSAAISEPSLTSCSDWIRLSGLAGRSTSSIENLAVLHTGLPGLARQTLTR